MPLLSWLEWARTLADWLLLCACVLPIVPLLCYTPAAWASMVTVYRIVCIHLPTPLIWDCMQISVRNKLKFWIQHPRNIEGGGARLASSMVWWTCPSPSSILPPVSPSPTNQSTWGRWRFDPTSVFFIWHPECWWGEGGYISRGVAWRMIEPPLLTR